MPGLNQTGPGGQGPMTGRRMGRCTNNSANQIIKNATPSDNKSGEQPENFQGRGFGFGRGRVGRGRGMGLQNGFRKGF